MHISFFLFRHFLYKKLRMGLSAESFLALCDFEQSGFYLLGALGSFPPNISVSFQKNFYLKKLKLFQILILFDDDIKESMKVTNVQQCDFSQS